MININITKIRLVCAFCLLFGTVGFFSLRLRQAEKEFFVANDLAKKNKRDEAGRHYIKASRLAWWEKRYYTYVAINQEIIGRSPNTPHWVRLESLEKSIQSYQKSLEVVPNDIWPTSGIARAYKILLHFKPSNQFYQSQARKYSALADRICPSRRFH